MKKMIQKITLTVMLLLTVSYANLKAGDFAIRNSSHANSKGGGGDSFEEGSSNVSVGYGFITFLGSLKTTYNAYTGVKWSQTGPVYVKYEYGITDKIGLGLNVAYASNAIEYNYDYITLDGNGNFTTATYKEKDSRTTISALARINFHFANSEKFDPYFGFGLGYRTANWKFTSNDPSGTSSVKFKTLVPLGFEATIGARYYFSEHVGLYAEVGAAKSVFQIGVTAKF